MILVLLLAVTDFIYVSSQSVALPLKVINYLYVRRIEVILFDLLTLGKTHVKTVPVKLTRATNDLHKDHKDKKFRFALIRHLEELASLLGPNEVIFLSQDDKARVPIGNGSSSKADSFTYAHGIPCEVT